MTQIGQLLNIYFQRRKENNPAYSMRAFARDLGISIGRTSEILAGLTVPGKKMTDRILARLNLDEAERAKIASSTELTVPHKQLLAIYPGLSSFLQHETNYTAIALIGAMGDQEELSNLADFLGWTIEDVEEFENQLRQAGLPRATLKTARFRRLFFLHAFEQCLAGYLDRVPVPIHQSEAERLHRLYRKFFYSAIRLILESNGQSVSYLTFRSSNIEIQNVFTDSDATRKRQRT